MTSIFGSKTLTNSMQFYFIVINRTIFEQETGVRGRGGTEGVKRKRAGRWLSKIFNDMKHRAAYLWQRSFLFISAVPSVESGRDRLNSIRNKAVCT